jgi:cathepsin D
MLNTGQSSSLQASSQSVSFTYSIGQAVGTFTRDTVSFGGFTVDNQVFGMAFIFLPVSLTHCTLNAPHFPGAVTQVLNNVIPTNAAGILGLAFQALAKTRAVPFWLALQNDNQLASPEFSFFLSRNEGRAASLSAINPGGALTLGGRNATLFQGDVDFQNFPNGVAPSFWWQEVACALCLSIALAHCIELTPRAALTLNNNSISFGNGLAAIDTGTTLLGGPQDAVENFWNAVPGAQSTGNGMWSFRAWLSLIISASAVRLL